ncbi:MAG: metallopeptidase family protein [Clostridiales Family XIII bacterium]|jgi:hypothetical protein|nr:metallopeptidase family protein [Clostridiales Family XIII bacterium]
MVTIDEMQDILDELAEELPPVFYEELNGGILLLPEAKRSEYAQGDDLYILGEYHHTHNMGRYISIYYGSFVRLFGENAPVERVRAELRKTLRHEFTHHLESLAGEDDLEKYDASKLGSYFAGDL